MSSIPIPSIPAIETNHTQDMLRQDKGQRCVFGMEEEKREEWEKNTGKGQRCNRKIEDWKHRKYIESGIQSVGMITQAF